MKKGFNVLRDVILYFLSAFFIFGGLIVGFDAHWAAFFLVLAGITLVPILKKKLKDKLMFKFNLKTRYQVVAFAIFFILGIALFPASESNDADTVDSLTTASESLSGSLDYLQPTELEQSPSPSPSPSPLPSPSPSPSSKIETLQDMIVHFLDVGQADSILIQLPNGQAMLIDGGNSGDSGNILSYMRNLDIKAIDYLVATHPHADHIGGLPSIIDAMDIGSIYMPDVSNNTQTFERLLTAIQNKGLQADKAKAGISILSMPDLQIDIVAPVRDSYVNLNDYSVVIKITYADTGFLFMGDAEALSEGDITADVSADVLKVGHHGSESSTTIAFLNKVSPAFAIISVGKGNSYGHPDDIVLSRLNEANISVFRTDLQGTVSFTSDGSEFTVNADPISYQPSVQLLSPAPKPASEVTPAPESAPEPAPAPEIQSDMVWLSATGTKYHKINNCGRMNPDKARQVTLEDAKSDGFEACANCRPPG